MNRIALLLVSCVLAIGSLAQIPQEKVAKPLEVILHVGDSCYNISNFYGAHQAYKKALNFKNKQPNPEVAYKCAEACRLYQNYKEAENYYKFTISLDSLNYPMAFYWYAEMLKYQGKYAAASKAFNDYYRYYGKDSEYHILKAEHEVVICADSVQNVGVDDEITLIRIPETSINSNYSEYSPCQFQDTVLYFSGIRPKDRKKADKEYDFKNYYTRIFKSTYIDSTWRVAEEVSGVNSSDGHTGNLCFGVNKDEVFFSRCELKEKYYCNIYRADYKNGKIKNAEIMPAPLNKKGYSTTNPSVVKTRDGEYMFFASDRPGGQGKRDIWYAKRKEDGSFEKPRNCGKRVNTFGDEVTPYYDRRDSLLFFSSELHNSLGGYDVFKSKGNITTNSWSKVANAGKPINSSFNDMYYHYADDSTTAYVVSNREESMRLIDEAHSNDIYYYKLVRRSIERISELVPLELYFDNDMPNPGTLDTTTEVVYEQLFMEYMDRKEEYIKNNMKGEASERKPYYEAIVNEFFTSNLERGWVKLFLFAELMEVILDDGYDIIITFKGYSSPLGNTLYNERIAKRRIACVQNFFDTFNGGVFNQYIDNEPETGVGSLRYLQVPIGETVAENTFMKDGEVINADDLESKKNLKKSVYSPAAALQRKIEILAVEIEEKAKLQEELDAELKYSKKEVSEDDKSRYGIQDPEDNTEVNEDSVEDDSMESDGEEVNDSDDYSEGIEESDGSDDYETTEDSEE